MRYQQVRGVSEPMCLDLREQADRLRRALLLREQVRDIARPVVFEATQREHDGSERDAKSVGDQVASWREFVLSGVDEELRDRTGRVHRIRRLVPVAEGETGEYGGHNSGPILLPHST